MKKFTTIIIGLLLTACVCKEHSAELTLVQKDEKFGYINKHGRTVIPLKYVAAKEFSEGLAAVRIGGYYGFINAAGVVVIAPQYEYAESFSDGKALVYKNEKRYFIDQKGKKRFNCPFEYSMPFHRGNAIVTAKSGNQGVIDWNGKLIIDTQYVKIDTLQGFYEAEKQDHKSVYFSRFGQEIHFPGKFTNLRYSDGYFHVFRKVKRGFLIDFYDKKLQKKARLRLSENYSLEGLTRNGMLRLILRKVHDPEGKFTDVYGHCSTYYDVESGKKMRRKFIETTDFSENRAFIKTTNETYRLIDRKGRIRSHHRFSNPQPFKNGFAIVSGKFKTGIIDTNGKYVIKPRYNAIIPMKNNPHYFFFKQYNRNDYTTYYGILYKDGTIIHPGSLEEVDYEGFVNELLIARKGEYKVLINTKGKIVWKASLEKKNKRFPLNIDYKETAHYWAENEINLYSSRLGVNPPLRFNADFPIPDNQLSLYVNTSSQTLYDQMYPGKNLYLVNQTNTPLSFGTIGNLMQIKVQAKDRKGKWQDIQKYPETWCGTARGEVYLPPGFCWHFAAPVFEGCFKTQLRVVMDYYTQESGKKKIQEHRIVSNTYSGSVNPGQFWRVPAYMPYSLMSSIY